MTDLKVGYVGMTHLGLMSAVAAADKGFETIGFDLDRSKTSRFNAGEFQLSEPSLDETFVKNKGNLHFTSEIQELASCDIIYISLDIPTDDQGQSNITGITDLIYHADQNTNELIPLIILSQVPPGFTNSLKISINRPIYYQVETLIFGQALQRALHPERIILGCKDPAAPLPSALNKFLASFDCPLLPMRYESAELAKISINCCLVSSITVANMLAELCEKTGADWSEISPALKLDKRIGAHAYLTPGLGISGGNLERDLRTVLELSAQHGTHTTTIQSWVDNSVYRKSWPLRTLYTHYPELSSETKISILGLAYKRDTDSIKNSPAIQLIEQLGQGQAITVYDPVVSQNHDALKETLRGETAIDTCEGADIVLIMTDWPEFQKLNPTEIVANMRGKLILDPYALLAPSSDELLKIDYVTLGVGGE